MNEHLGPYRIQLCLHECDLAATYMAVGESPGPLLLRSVRSDVFSTSWQLRIEHEVAALARIESAFLNSPIDCGKADGQLYIAYRFREGHPLATALKLPSWRIDSSTATANTLRLAIDILSGLNVVHRAGFVHRDMRPSHIIQTPNQRFVLGGFGPLCVAQAHGRSGYQAREFAMYASPELAGSIEHEVTPASDLYSLGVILHHSLIGKPPFNGQSMSEILFQHLTVSPEYQDIKAGVPDVLVQLIRRLTAKEVRDRYQSAESALADVLMIQAALEDESQPSIVIGRHDYRTELTAPSFVGRKTEVDTIDRQIDLAREGGSSVTMVQANSGMGKTRLIVESVRSATQKGLSVYRSVASDQVTQVPLAPLLEIIDQIASGLVGDEISQTEAIAELNEYRSEVATAMPSLANALGWTGDELAGAGELGQSRVTLAYCKALALSASQRPALICIDDCQWLDRSSLRILKQFVSETPKSICLLLGTRSSEGVSEQLAKALPNAKLIELGPLSAKGTCDLVESMAGRLPESVKNQVADLSQGSPFMATATMRGLVETKALIVKDGQWAVDESRLLEFQTASDAASVLLKRLEFVQPTALRLLSIGAVVGKQFDPILPIRLTGIEQRDAIAAIDSVRAQGLVWMKPDGAIAFVHDKVRDAFLRRQGSESQKDCHRKLAEYLAEHHPDDSYDLAYHYAAAGLPELAWPHALLSAQEAKERYAIESSETHFRIAAKAIDLSRDITKMDQASQHAIESGLAQSLLLLGKYHEAEIWLHAALCSAQTPLDEAKIRMQHGELAFKRGDKEQSLSLFEQALVDAGHRVPETRSQLYIQLAYETWVQSVHSMLPSLFVGRSKDPPSDELRMVWRLYSRFAHSCWYVRDNCSTLWGHLRGMNLAERYAPTEELAQAYSDHGPAMSLIPWFRRGRDYARLSIAIREAAGDTWGQGQSRNYLSIMLYASGNYEACLEEAHRAIALLQRTGDFWEIHMAHYHVAASLYRIGNLKEAICSARDLYQSAVKCEDYQTSGNAMDLWARASLGQVPQEIVALESSRPQRDHQGNCQLWLAEGVQLHMQQRYPEAIECFQRSVDAVKRTGVLNTYIAPNYCWLTTSLRMQLEASPPKAKRVRDKKIRAIKRAARRAIWVTLRFSNDLPHALREYAAVLSLEGKRRRATWLLKNSIRVATRQGAAYEAALSDQLLSEIRAEIHPSCSQRKMQVDNTQRLTRSFQEAVCPTTSAASLSVLDRFDSLLDAGRMISAAKTSDEILDQTVDAAQRLLRGERTVILKELKAVKWPGNSQDMQLQCVGKTQPFDPILARRAKAAAAAIISSCETQTKHGMTSEQTGAFLCCPIVHNLGTHYLYIANTQLTNLFGENERRIANFLASAAASALDRASGIEQMEELNASLERRVVERTLDVVARSKDLEKTAKKLLRAQAALETAKETAEKANRSKSDFLACMSHEIRTPMSAVLGFTEILMNHELDSEAHQQYLQRIQSNGQHLLSLLNDILDFSKIEAGRLETETISCLPYDLVLDAVKALESRAVENDVTLRLCIDGAIPEFIQSDPTRIRQIVTNLVGNAIKFTRQGTVDITLRMDYSGDDSDPRLEIDVSDTGIGITSEQYKQIFLPFTQADASTTRQYGGTGLGLTISKRLTQALGGDLYVSSAAGLGSTFVASLSTGPLDGVKMVASGDELSARNRSPAKKQRDQDLSGLSVMVVDDVDANRELIGFLLAGAGASVSFALNGQQAVDAVLNTVSEDAFDLIFMDMQMPVLDGYGATRRIREEGIEIPIVALTANTMVGDSEVCLAAGCNEYLSKPIDFDALLAAAGRYHNEETSGRESGSQRSGELTSNTTAGGSDNELSQLLANLRLEFSHGIVNRAEEFRDAIAKQDWEAVKNITHSLRGTGGTIGLTEIVNWTRAIEAAIQGDRPTSDIPGLSEMIIESAEKFLTHRQ